jgi:ABC-2 type transport system ATP-binding protein
VPAIVTGEEVTKLWGATRALAGATFEIGDGITGLLGANGAGKTTLLGLVLGMHRPDGGHIRVLGQDPWSLGPQVRARIGYAPEHEALPPDVTAHDLVRHLAEVHGLPKREATARASDALYEVGLGEERFRAVGTMSTGQRQRVKLAQAIAHDPDLVLLDEPTNGLDPMQRDQMLELIRRVSERLGHNIVLSSHLLDEVDRVSDAVVILDAGRVVTSGRLDELRQTGAEELLVDIDGGDGDAESLAAALRAGGMAATATGARVVVALDGIAVYDATRDAIADLGLAVRRLQRRTASLEELYLAGGVG